MRGTSFPTVRTAQPGDAAAIQAIYAPIVERTTISFEEIPPSIDEMAARIANGGKAYPYLIAEGEREILGFAYASQHRTRSAYRYAVDVSVYVAEGQRRTGVGKALYNDLLATLADRGFHAAFAGIALPNPASVALHQALGFKPVGVYHQVGFKIRPMARCQLVAASSGLTSGMIVPFTEGLVGSSDVAN